MKKSIIVLTLLAVCSIFSSAQGQNIVEPIDRADLVEGKIRIKLTNESLAGITFLGTQANGRTAATSGVTGVDDLVEEVGITRINRVFPFSFEHEEKHRKHGLHLWLELEFDPSHDPNQIAEQFGALSEVSISKPVIRKVWHNSGNEVTPVKLGTLNSTGKKAVINGRIKGTDEVVFNDPMLPQQWHYENDGSIGVENSDIDLTNAWTKTTGDSTVIVAIVDGGIDASHEDLKDNLWVNEAELYGEEGVDDDQNGYIDDIHGYNFVYGGNITTTMHGTHVAGTVGAVNNNGIGIAGVAGGDGSGNGVRLISCQVFDDRANQGGNFASAIVYGADQGAVISQNSWGYSNPDYYEPEIVDAINYFITEAGNYDGSPMRGGILFFATGNNGRDETHYPGAFDEVLAVAATGPSGVAAAYSNYGDWVDLSAPGGDQSFGHEGGVLSTLPGNEYGFMQGTSMACPHASGVAALAVAKFGGPEFTAKDLKTIILNATRPFEFEHNNKYGVGGLNAALALDENKTLPPDPITDLQATDVSYNSLTLRWTVPADEDNFQPSEFYLAIGSTVVSSENFEDQPLYIIPNSFEAGSEVTITLTGFWKKTDYWFAIKSMDRYENFSEISNIIKVTTTDAPYFKESTREIDFFIDVTQDSVQSQAITFSNLGEGFVYWNSSIINENKFWTSLEDWQQSSGSGRVATQDPILFAQTRPFTSEFSLSGTTNIEGPLPNHWQNDNTQFIAGISYEQGNDYSLFGSGNANAGLIQGTRFSWPNDGGFNLTHIEAALMITSNEEPIYIEIKTGSNDILSAETVYVQEYYPDTAGVAKMFRIPLYRPQMIKNNEPFWVVLHLPKEELFPMIMEVNRYGTNFDGLFRASIDNGLTFKSLNYYNAVPLIPVVRAMSTGNDGSYVFIDPLEGKIAAGETSEINITVDAAHLSNGNHLASLGIFTSDNNKPGINIAVKVQVSGQEAAITKEELYRMDAWTNENNNLSFEVSNSGLSTLEIYGVNADSIFWKKDFQNTISVEPNASAGIPMIFRSASSGIINQSIALQTNIGEIKLQAELVVKDPPRMQMQLDTAKVVLGYGEKGQVALTVKNTGTGSALDYSLDHYSNFSLSTDKLGNKLEYLVSSSDDTGGPTAGQWDEISGYSEARVWSYLNDEKESLNFAFPFEDHVFENVSVFHAGLIYFIKAGNFYGYPSTNPELLGKGMFAPLKIFNMTALLEAFYFHSFGDRAVMSFNFGIREPGNIKNKTGRFEYQVVLFRNGSVEYRYKDVADLSGKHNYEIGVKGLQDEKQWIFKSKTDTVNTVHDGLVVRFEPISAPSILRVEQPTAGMLNQGDSVVIPVIIDPTILNLGEGIYDQVVTVYANTAQGTHQLPMEVEISGSPLFSAQDSVSISETNTGQSNIGYITVENNGSGNGSVDSIQTSNSDFSISNALPVTINSGAHQKLTVSYSPSVGGAVTAILTLTYNDGTQEDVLVSGVGKTDPTYQLVLPESLAVSLQAGQTQQLPLTIINDNADSELEYYFKNSVFTSVESGTMPKASYTSKDHITTDYGYNWKMSDSLRVFYQWQDISTDSELLNIKQEEQKAVALPFEFPFYGGKYDTIWVSKNGYVTVSKPEGDSFSLKFKQNDGLKGMIAPLWSQLEPSGEEGGVKLKTQEDRIFLQWDKFQGGSSSSVTGGFVSFQLEIVRDGSIYFHYKDIEDYLGTFKYGLESPDELETLETAGAWTINASEIGNKTSIAISAPLKDNLQPGLQESLMLTFSAEKVFRPGSYTDTVTLYSNSAAIAPLDIPVTIAVTGSPALVVPDTISWANVIFGGSAHLIENLNLTNTGYAEAQITSIQWNNIAGVTLYDERGKEIVMNSQGGLFQPIIVSPWDVLPLGLDILVTSNSDVDGSLTLNGNFGSVTIQVLANLVDSPEFNWTATNQEFDLNNQTDGTYTFTMSNSGTTELGYKLIPSVTPPEDTNQYPIVIEEIGGIKFQQPLTIDSLGWDTKDKADGFATPQVPADLLFGSGFTAPQGGFNITHVKTIHSLKKKDEYVKVLIYLGGTDPMDGQLLFEQKFVIEEITDNHWIYFELDQPIFIPEGEKFYISIIPPPDNQYIGYEISSDSSALQESYYGSIDRWNGGYDWGTHPGFQMIWKIRPLTAAGKGQWLELDQLTGTLAGGESVDITATIDHEKVPGKTNYGKVLALTNDINNSKAEFSVIVNLNSAPELLFRPNKYEDTIRVVETNTAYFNYLINDPEGDAISMSLVGNTDQGPELSLEQKDALTAQLSVVTGYEDAGKYLRTVEIIDAAGNITTDTIVMEVIDKNRSPFLDPDFEVLRMNVSEDGGDVLTLDPTQIFTDPDGDNLNYFIGNGTPNIIDISLGNRYFGVHAVSEGTGYFYAGADDGKEDGFVVYIIYVEVVNSQFSTDAKTNSIIENAQSLLETKKGVVLYPNPVREGTANLIYKLEDSSNISIGIYNLRGEQVGERINSQKNPGIHIERLNVSGLKKGIYVCQIRSNDGDVRSVKMSIE